MFEFKNSPNIQSYMRNYLTAQVSKMHIAKKYNYGPVVPNGSTDFIIQNWSNNTMIHLRFSGEANMTASAYKQKMNDARDLTHFEEDEVQTLTTLGFVVYSYDGPVTVYEPADYFNMIETRKRDVESAFKDYHISNKRAGEFKIERVDIDLEEEQKFGINSSVISTIEFDLYMNTAHKYTNQTVLSPARFTREELKRVDKLGFELSKSYTKEVGQSTRDWFWED